MYFISFGITALLRLSIEVVPTSDPIYKLFQQDRKLTPYPYGKPSSLLMCWDKLFLPYRI